MSKDTGIHNLIIIGGGPSGLSAALYAARAELKPLVFAGSPPGGQLTLTSEIENFPGQTNITGPELVLKMREQATHFGAQIIDENLLSVDFKNEIHEVKTSTNIYRAKAVIIATGAKALWLNLPSEQRLRGRGVSACATCDGFFFRGKTVAVIGGGDTALEDASALTKFAKKIYIIHRRDSFRASKIMRERVLNHPNIEVIWNAHVEEVLGEQKVSGVKLNVGDKTRELALDGVFVAIGHQPDTELFKDQIRCDEKGYILTSAVAAYDAVRKGEGTKELSHDFNLNYQTATSQRGVFAAGVCVDRVYRQASTASGMGVAASLDAEHWLEE